MKYRVVVYLMLWLVALCYYILATGMAEITSIPPFDPFEQTRGWVRAGTDGKHVYNIISMLVESLLTIANGRCYFTSPGPPSKTSLLPFLTLEVATWSAYRAEHLFYSSEEFTIRTTHLSPGSSSAQRIDFSIRNTTTSTGRALCLR